jgi:subtilisin family serine protease
VTLVAIVTSFSIGVARVDGQTDPLLSQQWHLKPRSQEPAEANVEAVWSTTKGAGVVIGVVDDGLQYLHPDLQPNYSSALSFDFNFNDPDPSPNPSFDFHGTAVAGVAGARGENGIGVSGAAPLASLAGLRLIAGPASDAQEAAALGYQANVIHISSNSWGPSDDIPTLQGPGPLTQSAIEAAVFQGRGGKGRVFVWAAGKWPTETGQL